MSWIWLPGAPRGSDVLMFARRVVDAPGGSVTIEVTCDGRYALYVNDTEIGRGPVRGPLTVDAYTVDLRPGANVIGLLARNYGRPALYWSPGGPGGVALSAGGLVETDASWRVLRAPYTPVVPAPDEGAPDPEAIDGRAWPHGWLAGDLDDSSWQLADEIDGPSLSSLPPRPIAHLRERTIDLGTLSLEAGEARTLDAGTIVNAHVALSVAAGPGAELDLRCGEDADGDAPLLDVRDWSLRYTAAGARHPEEVVAFEPVGFRYLRVQASQPAHVVVRARERLYPRRDGAWFRCSDPHLEAIWRAGVRTLDLCSTDAFVDCPGREQRAWLGDDLVPSLVSLTVSPDPDLVVRDLRLHASGLRPDGLLPMVAGGDFTTRPHTLPEQSLLWIRTLARVYEHTGDAALIAELWPVARGILRAFAGMLRPDGLVGGYVHGLHGWWFIDWAQLERGDRIAAVDALHAMALRDALVLAPVAGDDPAPYAARHGALQQAFDRYWEPSRGAYVDAAWEDGRTGRRISQQANAAAICGDLVPADRIDAVLARICDPARVRVTLTPGDGGTFGERLNRQWEDPPGFDDGEHVVAAQPQFAHHLHQALALCGRHDLLLPSIRRWSDMVARNGCVQEYWTALPGMGSRAHAWSATPTYDLVAHVLGARPAAPGWASVRTEPHLGDLDWAEARIATPRGWLQVRAEHGRAPVVEWSV